MHYSGKKIGFRTISLISLGVAVFVLAGILLLSQTNGKQVLRTEKTPADNLANSSAETSAKELAERSALADDTESAATDTSITPSPAPSGTNSSSANTRTADTCMKITKEHQEQYKKELKAEKETLDNTLSFQVGLNISGQYVQDYNESVSKIYYTHTTAAAAEGCELSIQKPPLLPETYPY